MIQIKNTYQKHSEASRVAAKNFENKVPICVSQVYAFIKIHRLGATDDEIQAALNMDKTVEIICRENLMVLDMIRDSGIRRESRNQNKTRVWITA